METFTKLFGSLLVFVYDCFDRIVIRGYLSRLSRPDQMVYFFRQVVGAAVVDKTVLSQRTEVYRNWVEAFARNHHIPMEWPRRAFARRTTCSPICGAWRERTPAVYFIFKSMERGATFRSRIPKFATPDPNHRILAHQRSRFAHYYFYLRDTVLGPMVIRVGLSSLSRPHIISTATPFWNRS
jgi:hypothetical protein